MRRRERLGRVSADAWGHWPYALPFGRVQRRAWRSALARRRGLRCSQVRVSARNPDGNRLAVVVRLAGAPTVRGDFKATDRGRGELVRWLPAPYSCDTRGFPSR